MIDYNAFHHYLIELVALYQRTRTTKGMSELARTMHCTALTRDQFYQMNLDKLTPDQVTPQLARVIRDAIGKSDAKAVLRESIGALNEGILAGSRISQGSDRTVQITITQPAPPAPAPSSPAPSASVPSVAVPQQQPTKKSPYKVGQVLFAKDIAQIMLVTSVSDGVASCRYALPAGLHTDFLVVREGIPDFAIRDEKNVRPAKGNEVARFLGALTREGYEWTADNANGLFYVTGKRKEQTRAEVFANDLPDGYRGLYPLPITQPSPYRFAMACLSAIDNADQYMMLRTAVYPALTNAVLRQMKSALGNDGFDAIAEYCEYIMPTLCCTEEIHEYTIGFVKDTNNGTSYWLARDRDVLRLLSWVSFIV